MSTFKQVRGLDGGSLTVEADDAHPDESVIAVVHDDTHGTWCDFDRAGAVSLIEALTAAVEAADAREAEEARKLKRGDRVNAGRTLTYTVITDEDEHGRVDIVSHRLGIIYERRPARTFTRIR